MAAGRPTLRQFLLREPQKDESIPHIAAVMEDIAQASRRISLLLSQGALGGALGAAGTENVQGEEQKKLDIISNEIMIECLEWSAHWAGLASEEIDDIVVVPGPQSPSGRYLCLFDPLDGSSNIDTNGAVGTIFSILRCPEGVETLTSEHFLQPGTAQLAAGFALYGPSTILILTTGNGVNGFTLDRGSGDFVLTHPDMKVQVEAKDFTINMSNKRYWTPPIQRYIDELVEEGEKHRGLHFNMRWMGSMVADVYRLLISGGIFLYPWDSKVAGRPGKLRLLYEVNPISFLIEQAGGVSTTGTDRTMEIMPESLHQRSPAILGSKNEVERVISYHLEQVGRSQTQAAFAAAAALGSPPLPVALRLGMKRKNREHVVMRLKIIGLILAGGKGTRLSPLTKERAKPAVPFAGKYRIVDFVLSNFINSGIFSVYVLIQFRSQSLLQHLRDGWQFDGMLNEHFIIPVPAQMRTPGENWYRGTADAVWQNANLIEQSRPDLVVLFGADHIYLMDIRQMIEFHASKGAGVTIAAIPVDKKFAKDFGVLEVDGEGRIKGFVEKDPNAPTMPGDPNRVLASMGNYIFNRDLLLDMVNRDAANAESSHDFGKDILPALIGKVDMYAYDFQTNRVSGDTTKRAPYWRDVGTLDAYYEASMDMRSIDPPLNLYNRQWPVRTAGYSDPPAKFAFDEEGRRGEAHDSILSGGCILSGGQVKRSILGRWVNVHSGALVEDCVLFDGVDIGRRAKIRNAILEKNLRIPEDAVIGYDPAEDAKRYQLTESGLVIIGGERSPVGLSSLHI